MRCTLAGSTLGLGRSGGKPREPAASVPAAPPSRAVEQRTHPERAGDPARVRIRRRCLKSPRFALHKALLQLPGAQSQNYTEQVDDVLALIADTYRSADGVAAHVVPGRAALTCRSGFWAAVAGRARSSPAGGACGSRPTTTSPRPRCWRRPTGTAPRSEPSAELDRPYVAVSADVVVAEDEATARELAAGYGPWVRSIRTGEGAIPYPTPDEARRHRWTDADRELVADRVETQFVGSAVQVADQLERLRDATEADELIITTITHDHQDRVRSYELLAEEWARR